MGAGPNSDAKKAEGEEAAAGGSSKLFRCACVRRWLPPAYGEELCHVLRLTGPLVSGRGSAACSSVITVLRSDVRSASGLVMPPAAPTAGSCLDYPSEPCSQRSGIACETVCFFLQLLSRILNYLLPFVTTIFVGHIGNAELAGYALASAVTSSSLLIYARRCLLFFSFFAIDSFG